MKYSQFYILIGQICFVGSFLTNHVWDSFLLFAMFICWNYAGFYMMIKERDLARIERNHERAKHERAKFELFVDLLEQKRKRK